MEVSDHVFFGETHRSIHTDNIQQLMSNHKSKVSSEPPV